MVSNWEPAHSLVEDAVSWDKIATAPCLLALAVAQLPLCFQEVGAYMAASLLNPLFCESTRGHHEALEPFVEMILYFCLSGDPRVWVAVSHYTLRLSSWHSGLVLTLRTDDWVCTSLPSPHSLVVDTSNWATFLSPLVVVVRCVFCAFFFFFLLLVMLPSEIPKLPLHTPVRGSPTVWKLFLLTTPSPGWVSVTKFCVSVFVFYILYYLLLKRLDCLSGSLVSSASIQKLFCGSCSTFKWSFDEFVGGKVVSPIPPPSWDLWKRKSIFRI